jgi:ribosomal protein S18 acetylase RimI-like enzyme
VSPPADRCLLGIDDVRSLTRVIAVIDPADPEVARRIVEIQQAAYAVEASLIGFNGIPQLTETAEDVIALSTMQWRGVFESEQLAGVIAWELDEELVDIDRLAVAPRFGRRGYGRRLVRAVPTGQLTIVSTGTENLPARDLYLDEGFVAVGQTEIATGIFTTQFSRAAR